MLEIRPNCENCNKELSYNSVDAMICSFECTFCSSCVTTILHNVCPNCCGGFEKRPIRPNEKLLKYPVRKDSYFRPVDIKKFKPLMDLKVSVNPSDR